MLTQISALLAVLAVAFPLLIKVAVAIGGVGSAIELLGLFLQRFAHPAVRATGGVFVRIGKVLEAIGVDAPKVITNALGWVLKLAQFLKDLSNVAILAVVVSVGLLGVVACTAAEAQRNVETARDTVNEYCDARAKALEVLSSAGSSGAGGSAGTGGSAGSAGAP